MHNCTHAPLQGTQTFWGACHTNDTQISSCFTCASVCPFSSQRAQCQFLHNSICSPQISYTASPQHTCTCRTSHWHICSQGPLSYIPALQQEPNRAGRSTYASVGQSAKRLPNSCSIPGPHSLSWEHLETFSYICSLLLSWTEHFSSQPPEIEHDGQLCQRTTVFVYSHCHSGTPQLANCPSPPPSTAHCFLLTPSVLKLLLSEGSWGSRRGCVRGKLATLHSLKSRSPGVR